ncbi:uncharacterized protein EI90DRAFT_1487495 [Cantharellus anzutake]|uniref:uncharacterized protein n=1 Tax=Cantharellus anzutake TaxID=1750568 RepID=UPI001904B237|nr:uncharacterized protein EI90DRAFT_1487495 [Cantharellus anzutake]KAF8328884.1 hypothetical protein EI90DRAFT_1487495 [Cantharellus anzutake]
MLCSMKPNTGRRQNDPNNNMDEAAKYWYNGQVTQTPKAFPGEMEEALSRIEELVNEQISKRKRFPFEWAGSPKAWRANVAASNCYRGSKEGVGPHSDRLTYLGPYPTIASLSLGTTRTFRLREVIPAANKEKRQAQTFDIPLPHNSLLIMHPPTQEFFKHSIPTVKSIDTFRPNHPRILGEDTRKYNERINITFRFYRPDFQPTFIPRCHCEGNIPMTLKSNQKRRGEDASFFWQCQAGAQNEGKTCYYWKEMDMEAEGRGPCIKDIPT